MKKQLVTSRRARQPLATADLSEVAGGGIRMEERVGAYGIVSSASALGAYSVVDPSTVINLNPI